MPSTNANATVAFGTPVPSLDATYVAAVQSFPPKPTETPRSKSAAEAVVEIQKTDRMWASGLCETLARSINHHPSRIVILDNSGSMQANDGKKLVWNNGNCRSLPCSRWTELVDDAESIAKLSAAVDARTDFHLLNPAPGFRSASIRAHSWSTIAPPGREVDASELAAQLKRIQPGGTTPLTEAVMQVVSQLEPHAAQLRADGQAVAVLICTDGLPNNKQTFVQAMRLLQTMPVWCVVRLCTDDDDVVEYWNDLDKALEAPLEVLDDVRGEAHEVHALNPWLTYGPPLHSARLFGLPDKLFDALDEHQLVPSQIKQLCEMLFGVADLPEPELDQPAFLEALRTALQEQPPTYDARQGKMRPWVDLRALERSLNRSRRCGPNGKNEGCCVM